MDRLIEFAYCYCGAAAGRRMRVEHHRVAGGDDVDNVAGQGRDRVGRGCHRTDDAERCELLKRDAVITAATVRPQPLDTRHIAYNLKLLDLVIEPAYLRFLQLDAAPLFIVVLAKALDDFDNSAACLDTLPAQLLKRLGRGITRLVGGLENAKIPANTVLGLATTRSVVVGRRGRRHWSNNRRAATQAAKDVLNHVANQCFIYCICHVVFLVLSVFCLFGQTALGLAVGL